MAIKSGNLLVSTALAVAAVSMASGAQGNPLGVYARMDSNGDGKVSLAEFQARHATQLRMFDANKNGTVTISEVDAFFAGHTSGDSSGAQLAQQRYTALKAADTNGNGVISEAEFKTAGDAEFHAADTNNDGSISAAEADAAVP